MGSNDLTVETIQNAEALTSDVDALQQSFQKLKSLLKTATDYVAKVLVRNLLHFPIFLSYQIRRFIRKCSERGQDMLSEFWTEATQQ